MARSHHRKKHKTHVRQFRQNHDTHIADGNPSAKGKAAWILAIGGALAGFAISYFASNGSPLWVGLLTAAGGGIGYLVGNRMDHDNAD